MSTSSIERGPLALDLDGTLVDAKPRQVEALWALLDAEPRLLALHREEFWSRKRGGSTTCEALVGLGMRAAAAEILSQRWVESVEDPRWLRLDRLLPGVAAELEALGRAGERPVILTARRHADRAREQVEALGLLRWCGEVRVVSPAEAAAAKAAELRALGARGMIGDSESDARAAELAGLPFAAVTTGQRSEEFLAARGLASFGSLAGALGSLR